MYFSRFDWCASSGHTFILLLLWTEAEHYTLFYVFFQDQCNASAVLILLVSYYSAKKSKNLSGSFSHIWLNQRWLLVIVFGRTMFFYSSQNKRIKGKNRNLWRRTLRYTRISSCTSSWSHDFPWFRRLNEKQQ